MSSTEDQPGDGGLVAALRVQQNLKRGATVGVGFAALVFVFFAVIPSSTTRSRLYYLGLAFVLAISMSGLVAAVLVARRAYQLTQEL